MFGALAMLLNYLPYLGPACMVLILLGVGLVTFPTLGYALLPPACFIGLTTLEGQIITPMVLGHRLTLNPLAVFLRSRSGPGSGDRWARSWRCRC